MASHATTAPVSFDMGRVVKRTFSVLSSDLPAIGLVTLVFVAVPLWLQAWLQMQQKAAAHAGNLGSLFLLGLASLVVMFLVVAALSVANAAVMKIALGRLDGGSMGFGEAVAAGAPHWLMVFLTNLLVALGAGLAMLLFIVPGLILLIRWAVAAPVQVAEGLGPTGSMGRSAQLTKGHRWAIFGLMIVLGLVVIVIDGAFFAAIGGPLVLFSEKGLIAWSMLAPVVQLFIFPITAVGLASIYAELSGGTGAQATAAVFG